MGTKKGQRRKTARRAYDFSTRKGPRRQKYTGFRKEETIFGRFLGITAIGPFGNKKKPMFGRIYVEKVRRKK